MKIISRLTGALFVGTCVILSANGYLRVRRELAIFEADTLRDHEMIGRALAAAASATWKLEGEAPALASIRAVNEHFTRIHIRWIDTKSYESQNVEVGLNVPSGVPVSHLVEDERGLKTRLTYVPVDVESKRRGVLELSELTYAEQQLVQTVVKDTIFSALALALLSALLSFAMGQWLVGRPIRELSDKARRVGLGDFSGPIEIERDDELGALAGEMNTMSSRLTSTLEQLRHADRLATVGKLASGVAHELGTPLNVISARATMIATSTSIDEGQKFAKVIVAAAERMTNIVRQLMQFARRSGAKKSACDVYKLTQETLSLISPLVAKSAARVTLAEPDTDTTISVDPGQFQQVVTNLVMNAIQASRPGDPITLSFSEVRTRPPSEVDPTGAEIDGLCLRITDRGSGMDDTVLEHIFEPFFTTKDIGEGTGLGLPVSWGIVREHGGWIDVESKRGVGTTFSVILPR